MGRCDAQAFDLASASMATVTCPSTIVVNVGTTVTCNVTDANGVVGGQVTFTFSNANATVDTSSVKEGLMA